VLILRALVRLYRTAEPLEVVIDWADWSARASRRSPGRPTRQDIAVS
jgi:hypothetical protein